jgi:hypothetical protein
MNSLDAATTQAAARGVKIIAAIVAIGVALRLGVILLWPEKLLEDTDAYLAYAVAWADTGTFGYEGQPTAFRPPVYPWLLSLFGLPTAAWVATINVLAGAGTIVVVWLTARRLERSTFASAAAASLIAIDPLLAQYAGQAMTESLCTFESALLLLLITNAGLVVNGIETADRRGKSIGFAIAVGVVSGVSILTRPTYLAFCVLLLLATLVANGLSGRRAVITILGWVALGAAVPIGAWGVRNQLLLGTPIITTTHGGYTLLLGNNDSYYREVVGQSLSTEWPGVEVWSASLNRSLEERGIEGEVERDRALRDEAVQTIRRQPALFARACLLRFLNFWAIIPGREARTKLPMAFIVAIGFFYIAWWLLSLWGLVAAIRRRCIVLVPSICLIVAFASVHTIYWSNARMRAPVLPALALLAAFALAQCRESRHRA